jgi:hypothetical protein
MVDNFADSGTGSLRQAVLDANANPGADLIRFAAAARHDSVVLTSGQLSITDNLEIDGPGADRLAVSGNDASRVFEIGSGAAVTIDGLTITHGHVLLRGGGIRNDGTLTLSHAVVSDNEVIGLPGFGSAVDPLGGGIFNTGSLAVHHSLFIGNRSTGADGLPGGPGSAALGGAIMSLGSVAAPASTTVSYSTFLHNQAVGGAAAVNAPLTRGGIGGAIMNDAGTMDVSYSLFDGNRAGCGAGGGGFVAGGAIANLARSGNATLSVHHSVLTNNQAVGGTAPSGTSSQIGRGGAIANFVAFMASLPVTVSAVTNVTDSMILGNVAKGGDGPTGGTGQGGGITNENGGILTVTDSLITLNRAVGGAGHDGNGGNGLGGGVFNGPPNPFGAPHFTLSRSVVALNRAEGGRADNGGSAGLGQGGGLYLSPGGLASAIGVAIISANDASTSDDDVFGILT